MQLECRNAHELTCSASQLAQGGPPLQLSLMVGTHLGGTGKLAESHWLQGGLRLELHIWLDAHFVDIGSCRRLRSRLSPFTDLSSHRSKRTCTHDEMAAEPAASSQPVQDHSCCLEAGQPNPGKRCMMATRDRLMLARHVQLPNTNYSSIGSWSRLAGGGRPGYAVAPFLM